MKYFIPLVLIVVAALYFTIGFRLGYLTLTPAQFYKANGTNTYKFRLADDRQTVGVKGSCSVQSGNATLTFANPAGQIQSTQACQKGTWSLNLKGGGKVGDFVLKVVFKDFTGKIELNDYYEGGNF